jgi:diguanylate cyclase (GGDEF)-like protein
MGSVPGQVELLSESEHTRVVRQVLPDGHSVIRKEVLGPGREDRINHEVGILHRLTGVPYIVQLAHAQPDAGSILLEDVHGTPLSQLATPLDPARLVPLALELARAVAMLHQHGVVHRDINPSNILLAGDGQSPYLIDFALATTLTELRSEFAHPSEIVGTLPYLAPEQTGRTGHLVDGRADLYGLGATIYELATGRPPFGTGDPFRLVHDHLTRAATPPATVNPAVPPLLSDIIMHTLEKEPDNRYQTADGLVHDLKRLNDGARWFRIGERDAPLRLTEPSRLVGRDREISILKSSFARVRSGECRGIVVSGGSGVGKTALIEELRPIATARNGWFASGRFDRRRGDQAVDAVEQAFRGLGRLLLAEPEEVVGGIRERLLLTLGTNAGLAAAVLPEFSTLLGVPPDPGDPLTAQVRSRRAAVEILRAVASSARPVAFVIDDAQWAGETPLGLLDLLLTGQEEIEGLLVVVAYRDTDVDADHPLAPLLGRWEEHPGRVERLHLTNLDPDDLTAMVAEMLHQPPEAVTDLAAAIYGPTGGNPYETVELLNGLRREAILRPTASGWTWDRARLEERLARQNVGELLEARVDGLPEATRRVTEAMACLGGEATLEALAAATGLTTDELRQRLNPALDEGLLVMVARPPKVRFHHDRLREAVLSSMPEQRLRELRLSLARRLAGRPEFVVTAADQYLPVVDDLQDPDERSRVARLLQQAANRPMWIGESRPAEQLLAAAVRLTDDRATLLELNTARLASLVRLGRLAEADEVYETIVGLSTGPFDLIEATRMQIGSLTNRNRPEDAIALGLRLLTKLGWAVPEPDQVSAEIDSQLDWCLNWIDETSEADDLARPSVRDPQLLSAGALISQMMPACFFRDQVTMAYLALAAARLWAQRGPTRTLVGVVGHVPWVLIGRRQAYRSGYRLIRRLLAVAEARDFEPYTSQVRFLYALGLAHWFEPIEDTGPHERRAREGLVRGGDLPAAAYTFCTPVYALDLATLDEYTAEVDAALAFAERTGNDHAAGLFRPYRWMINVLRGDSGSGPEMTSDQGEQSPLATANIHVTRALVAAMFEDQDALERHSAAAMAQRQVFEATYAVWQTHLVRALALARRVTDEGAERAEFDEILAWIAQRAEDMPANFRHMLNLIRAERAHAAGDFRTAIHAFDSALNAAARRPWHRAFIAERLAKFLLAHDLHRIGWALLVEAREAYRIWGARGKVSQLDRSYPSLEIPTEPFSRVARRSSITAGAIDMISILDASRALSSETSIGSLRDKVVDVLSTITSATSVELYMRNEERNQWRRANGDERGGPGHFGLAPEAILRYVERTHEPLIIGDATRDDRFARDPYFAGVQVCSILAVPVLSRGTLRAILLLENRLIRDAFPAERLEVVMLIAGQLAVSLDNAFIYSSLERKVAERTRQLALANERLSQLSITDPLTGLANRRRLEESLQHEWQRAGRTLTPLSLAMVDIDHFKRYNDEHGHREGDRCLQRIAAQLERSVRDTDLVARYGGEEFAIVMPDTDATAAREVAERVRHAISSLAEPLTTDRVVTASVGVATLHDREKTETSREAGRQALDRLVERADNALYEAKRAGRNRVRSADIT